MVFAFLLLLGSQSYIIEVSDVFHYRFVSCLACKQENLVLTR